MRGRAGRHGLPPLAAAAAGGLLGRVRAATAVSVRDPARDVPPGWEPAPLRWLAGWDPPPARGVAARTAVRLWAAPMTLAGLVAGAASGVAPRHTHGVLVFAEVRGPVRWWLRSRRVSAGALGHVVVSAVAPSADLLAHELVHVRQAERLGPAFPLAYGLLYLAYGYARHPLERAARAGARALRAEGS